MTNQVASTTTTQIVTGYTVTNDIADWLTGGTITTEYVEELNKKWAFERNNLLGFFPNFSDYMITWGNMTKQYIESCGITSNKIKALGSTFYDTLFTEKIYIFFKYF